MEKNIELTDINDTIDIEDFPITEEDNMLSRYHFHNIIYLYSVFEFATANNIIGTNDYNKDLVLFETPKNALKACNNQNIKNPRILRFAVNIDINNNYYTYDELVEESKEKTNAIIKSKKITKEDFLNKCAYVRKYDSKLKMIVYRVKPSAGIIISVQNI